MGPPAGVKSAASRDAKSANAELQALLKSKNLESNEVQFARQQLRRTYAAMLFQPRAVGGASPPKMLDVLNLLWIDTTHAFIARYRSKIASFDKSLADSPQQDASSGRGRGRGKRAHPESTHQGPVARRRLVQSFRTFLSAEEQYWTELLVKMIKVFSVPQAASCLQALGISASMAAAPASERANPAEEVVSGGGVSERASQVPDKIALLLCHKALISSGDLARYKELYSDAPSAAKSNKREPAQDAAVASNADRNWSKAQECYNQARLLVPEDGQPFNQLAVLASYSNDVLASVYHYYRALCVSQDFKSAKPNLEMTLSKALKKYEDAPVEMRLSDVELFSADFIALQAMIYLGRHELVIVESQMSKTLDLFRACLSNRLLSSEVITKVICTCVAAWHQDRMMSHGSSPHTTAAQIAASGASPQSKAAALGKDPEAMALRLILGFLGTTFKEAAESVESMFEGKIPTEPASRDIIASRIAPVLRRSLPAIRIGSKWLLSRSSGGRLATYGAHVSAFWNNYATLVNVLARRFPTKHLPDLPNELVLEENIDLAGFLPLSGALRAPISGRGSKAAQAGSDSHPNHEHLMRIADVLSDAALIASSSTTPVGLEKGIFTVKFELNPTAQQFRPPGFMDAVQSSPFAAALPAHGQDMSAVSDGDEEEDEVLLRDVSGAHLIGENQMNDDSDVVDLAMRAATMHHSDADELLYPSAASPSTKPIGVNQPNAPLAGSPLTEPASINSQSASDLLLGLLQNGHHQPFGSPSRSIPALPHQASSSSPSPSLRNASLSASPSIGSIWGTPTAQPMSRIASLSESSRQSAHRPLIDQVTTLQALGKLLPFTPARAREPARRCPNLAEGLCRALLQRPLGEKSKLGLASTADCKMPVLLCN